MAKRGDLHVQMYVKICKNNAYALLIVVFTLWGNENDQQICLIAE